MADIQEKVWRTQGVALEREVVLLPEDLAWDAVGDQRNAGPPLLH